MDGWHVDDGSSGSSTSTTGSLPMSLLGRHASGVSFGSADHSSCTNSAIAFKEEEDYLEQQLCQVYMDLDMDHLFSAELFPAEQWQQSPSSSSPPRKSLSTSCSPDNSTQSLHFNNMSSINPSTTIPSAPTRPTSTFAAQPAPHQATSRPAAYDQCREVRFPASTREDMAITSAMLAVLSSSSSAAPASASDKQSLQPSRTVDQFRSGFRPYSSADLSVPVHEPKKKKYCSSSSQKMIKSSISILRRIELMRDGSGTTTKNDSLPSNNQLHHVMSERKRREKLNGSFHTLRMLLPPGSKKDKASVLHKAKDYLKTLKVQILELEKKNQMLEKSPYLSPLDDDDDDDDTKEGIIDEDGGGDDSGSVGRVCVRIITEEALQHVRGVERISLKITVAAGCCDLIELALGVLECLKRMGVLSLLSMDANNYCSSSSSRRSLQPFTWIKFKFEIKASDWDEVTFKEAVAGAVHVTTVEEIHDNPLVTVP